DARICRGTRMRSASEALAGRARRHVAPGRARIERRASAPREASLPPMSAEADAMLPEPTATGAAKPRRRLLAGLLLLVAAIAALVLLTAGSAAHRTSKTSHSRAAHPAAAAAAHAQAPVRDPEEARS